MIHPEFMAKTEDGSVIRFRKNQFGVVMYRLSIDRRWYGTGTRRIGQMTEGEEIHAYLQARNSKPVRIQRSKP